MDIFVCHSSLKESTWPITSETCYSSTLTHPDARIHTHTFDRASGLDSTVGFVIQVGLNPAFERRGRVRLTDVKRERVPDGGASKRK